MMRTKLIAALFCGLTASSPQFAQKKPESGVKIVCPLMEHPEVLKMVTPTYPEAAKQAHIEGTVVLKCRIGVDGSVEKIELVKGNELLVPSAMEAVSQWKYAPLKLNEKPIPAETTVRIILQLPKEDKKSDRK